MTTARSSIGCATLDRGVANRFIRGGFASQPGYGTYLFRFDDPDLERYGALSPAQKNDMLLAHAICKTNRSNTITLVKDLMVIGNGVGQKARNECCRIAIAEATGAGHQTAGAIAASDAFFPFPDGAETLGRAGVAAVLTLKGSRNDEAVCRAFAEHGVTLYWLPVEKGRIFLH